MRRSGSTNQCFFCGQYFAGPKPYGLHFHPSTAACLSPDAMRAAGLRLNDVGFWSIDPPRPVVYDSTIGAT